MTNTQTRSSPNASKARQSTHSNRIIIPRTNNAMNSTHYEVLEYLSGSPIISQGLTPEQIAKINEIARDLSTESLLDSLPLRSSVLILSPRMNTLTPLDQEKITEKILLGLTLPKGLNWFDETKTTQQVTFKTNAENYLFLMNSLLHSHSEGYKSELQAAKIINVISSFSVQSPWSSTTSIELQYQIVSLLELTDPIIADLSSSLANSFKTLKQSKVSPAGYKNFYSSLQVKGLNPHLGFNESSDRFAWKSDEISSISKLAFLISNTELKDLKGRYWGLVIPSVLNILDDYEVGVKLLGVEVLSTLLLKFQESLSTEEEANETQSIPFLKQTGLYQVFLESVTPLLTYLPNKLNITSEVSSHILDKSYNLTFLLIQSFHEPKEYDVELLKLLNQHIFHNLGLVKDNLLVLEVLVSKIIIIVKSLKLKTMKCLPRLLYTVGILLSDPFLNCCTSSSILSKLLDLLILILLNCWVRISRHRFDILGMIILAYKKEDNTDDVNVKIETSLRLLNSCVGEEGMVEFKQDFKRLVESDSGLEGLLKEYLD